MLLGFLLGFFVGYVIAGLIIMYYLFNPDDAYTSPSDIWRDLVNEEGAFKAVIGVLLIIFLWPKIIKKFFNEF